MIKYTLCLLTLVSFTLPIFALEGKLSADAINGVWWTPKKDARIEISETNGLFNGKIIWGDKDAQEFDIYNPDPTKHGDKLVGMVILRGFKFADEKWVDGTIYDPKNGKTYSCKMTLEENGDLRVRGFIGISLFGRTEVFTPYRP